jgi:hypothetical protein
LSFRFHFSPVHCKHWANIGNPSFLATDTVSSAGFVEYVSKRMSRRSLSVSL